MADSVRTSNCPRCGPCQFAQPVSRKEMRCPQCAQYLSTVDADYCAADDATFAEPFRYERSMISVPGQAEDCPTLMYITQKTSADLQRNFVPRDSDVWLASYPKSGTTWLQNIISYLLYDKPSATKGVSVGMTKDENVWFIEGQLGCRVSTVKDINSLPLSRRRCFKTHLPLGLLEPLLTAHGKVVHIARNPKDVAVSDWHHTRTRVFGYDGPFPHFLERLFLPGHLESGSWWAFVMPFCQASARCAAHPEPSSVYSKVLTLWYEKVTVDPVQCTLDVARFLDVDITPERAAEISRLCSFQAMRDQEDKGGILVSYSGLLYSAIVDGGWRLLLAFLKAFFTLQIRGKLIKTSAECSSKQVRAGGSGGWKTYFTVAQSEAFDAHHARKVAQINARRQYHDAPVVFTF